MAAGQLKKMEKIWKGQDKQTKLKTVRACIFPTAISLVQCNIVVTTNFLGFFFVEKIDF